MQKSTSLTAYNDGEYNDHNSHDYMMLILTIMKKIMSISLMFAFTMTATPMVMNTITTTMMMKMMMKTRMTLMRMRAMQATTRRRSIRTKVV